MERAEIMRGKKLSCMEQHKSSPKRIISRPREWKEKSPMFRNTKLKVSVKLKESPLSPASEESEQVYGLPRARGIDQGRKVRARRRETRGERGKAGRKKLVRISSTSAAFKFLSAAPPRSPVFPWPWNGKLTRWLRREIRKVYVDSVQIADRSGYNFCPKSEKIKVHRGMKFKNRWRIAWTLNKIRSVGMECR